MKFDDVIISNIANILFTEKWDKIVYHRRTVISYCIQRNIDNIKPFYGIRFYKKRTSDIPMFWIEVAFANFNSNFT